MHKSLGFLNRKKKFWLAPVLFGVLLLAALMLMDAGGENGFFYARF